jgi:hypothetical protein
VVFVDHDRVIEEIATKGPNPALRDADLPR